MEIMLKLILIVLLIVAICNCNEIAIKHRVKRKVLFTKNSKVFFRLNGKESLTAPNPIFAHGWGFKVNFDLPETEKTRHKFFKRDVPEGIEDYINIDGFACIFSNLCQVVQMIKSSRKCGIFCKIGEIIAATNSLESDFFLSILDNCQRYTETCHLHLNRINIMKWLVLFVVAIHASVAILDTSRLLLSRRKRHLIFQPGLNWVQMVIGISLPSEIDDQSITFGAALKSYYRLPTNSSDFLRPTLNLPRRKRNLFRPPPTRWEIYAAIEKFMEKFQLGDGKSCLLRSICEATFAPFDEKRGLMGELVHAILRPSSTKENPDSYSDLEYHAAEKLGKEFGNCKVLFPECKFHYLARFTSIFN